MVKPSFLRAHISGVKSRQKGRHAEEQPALHCTKPGRFDPSIPPTTAPTPPFLRLSKVQTHTCTFEHTHIHTPTRHTHSLAPYACRPGSGPVWLTGALMYRLHLNFTHFESHKAKVITILLQPALHRRAGQDAQQNVCQIKNTFAAALNSTSKKHMRERGWGVGGEQGGGWGWSDILTRGNKNKRQTHLK